MSIISASILPNNPLLLQSISRNNFSHLQKTITAINIISKKLASSKIDTIFIITKENKLNPSSLTLNLDTEYTCNFEEFGDIETKRTWQSNIGLTHKIRESLETKTILQMISKSELNYETSIPLYLLSQNIDNIKIIPLYTSQESNQKHFDFGKLIKKELIKQKERIAIICAGDLSHKIEKNSPIGYTPKAKKFDKKIIEYLKQNKIDALLAITPENLIEIHETAFKPILILMGILNNIKHNQNILSYEHPFGIGHLVMDFEL